MKKCWRKQDWRLRNKLRSNFIKALQAFKTAEENEREAHYSASGLKGEIKTAGRKSDAAENTYHNKDGDAQFLEQIETQTSRMILQEMQSLRKEVARVSNELKSMHNFNMSFKDEIVNELKYVHEGMAELFLSQGRRKRGASRSGASASRADSRKNGRAPVESMESGRGREAFAESRGRGSSLVEAPGSVSRISSLPQPLRAPPLQSRATAPPRSSLFTHIIVDDNNLGGNSSYVCS